MMGRLDWHQASSHRPGIVPNKPINDDKDAVILGIGTVHLFNWHQTINLPPPRTIDDLVTIQLQTIINRQDDHTYFHFRRIPISYGRSSMSSMYSYSNNYYESPTKCALHSKQLSYAHAINNLHSDRVQLQPN